MKSNNFSDKVVEYIVECSLEQLRDLTIEDIAAHFGITKMTLTTRFRAHKSMTPGKFILREKMYRVLVLMARNPKLTVEELKERVGFSTSDYFIRVFRDHFGTSPGRYRDALEKNSKSES